jgi:hypothetical protein
MTPFVVMWLMNASCLAESVRVSVHGQPRAISQIDGFMTQTDAHRAFLVDCVIACIACSRLGPHGNEYKPH